MGNLQTHRAFSLLGVLFFLAGSTQIAQAQVIINEIYPNPNTGENEWVELFNTSQATVDLLNWKLWDMESSPGVAHDFTETTLLDPGAFLVVTLHNIFNNTGDTVILKNSAEQEIDELGYTSSTKGKSWARNPDNLAEILLANPTQGEANLVPSPSPTPTPTPTPGSTLSPTLTEFMACPDDTAEWFELHNPHTTELNLLGFTIWDSKAKIYSFTDEKLEPQEYVAFEFKSSVLNNSGDTISLISPDNQVLESFAYTQCAANSAWAKRGDTWEQTTIITPNSPNIFSAANQIDESTASAALNSLANPNQSSVLGAVTSTTSDFLYPPSVLKPKLSYDKPGFPTSDNIAFLPPPRLEAGALSVIMGSSLLLIPGAIYVKNRYYPF
jgi:hypothetical protein